MKLGMMGVVMMGVVMMFMSIVLGNGSWMRYGGVGT